MTEPDPEVIRMIAQGAVHQNPLLPVGVEVPRGQDGNYQHPNQPSLSPTDMGVDGHRRSERLDADEPNARTDEWHGMPVVESLYPWPV